MNSRQHSLRIVIPGSKGMAKMLFDAQRAVDVLESLAEVDSSRIGCMGHSLGAKEALYLGAFDDRVKVIVSNEGGIGIKMSNWDAVWYLSKDIDAFGHKHHEVLSLAAPKPFLLIGGDSADGEQSRPYIEAVKPVYGLYNKEENHRTEKSRNGAFCYTHHRNMDLRLDERPSGLIFKLAYYTSYAHLDRWIKCNRLSLVCKSDRH